MVLPSSELDLVLQALSQAPFEPLHQASFKHLTYKTVLLAIASVERHSELQALVYDTK